MNIFTDKVLVSAGAAAAEVSTKAGRTPRGWIRLARVASMTDRDVSPYVIAVRPLKDGGVHFGCSCPDWVNRRQFSNETCKHQKAFLAHMKGSSPNDGIWLYNSGEAFLRMVATHAALDGFKGLKITG